MVLDAKEILYSILREMGKDKIESEIVSNLSQIPFIIKEIFSRCVNSLQTNADRQKMQSDIAEALMHYLLTVIMLPSERKIKHGDIEIDLVIPNGKQLHDDPQRALVIFFPKSIKMDDINARLDKLLKVQPKKSNIWMVCGYYDDTLHSFNEYTIFVQDDFADKSLKPLSSIIDAIKYFVEKNKIKSFRIFPT
jgi:hypothetical protein